MDDRVSQHLGTSSCAIRYRAYWVAALSQLESRTCVAIAHEFGMLRRWQRRLSRKIYAREVAFAGVSPAVTAELAAVVGDAHLLPNGMDLSGFLERLQSPEQALAQLQLDPGPFTVGVVGRLHYKKRPELALAAFRKFRDVVPDSRLVFVGDGEPLVDEPGIHFLGRVADVRYLFCAFDALLVTSTQDEAFGMVALEAMAAGVPVATAPIPGPSYVLDDLGLYAQQANVDGYVAALIAAQHSDRATLRGAGRQRVAKEFSVSAAASRLDDLLTGRLTNRQTY